MRFMQIESVLQTKNRSEPAKNRFSVALVSCIPESGCCCLFIPIFLPFLSLQFSNIKIFHHTFIRTVRPRRLKLGTHVDSGWMYSHYSVYQNQTAAAYLSLFYFSNIQVLKFWSHFSQEL